MTTGFVPFIRDQLWSVLITGNDPQPFLTTRHFRTGRSIGMSEREENPWRVLELGDRLDIIRGDFSDSETGQRLPSRLIAIVSDAGVGKTCTTEFFGACFNTSGMGGLAIPVKLPELCQQSSNAAGSWLRRKLIETLRLRLDPKPSDEELGQLIDRQLYRGRLMVVLDALDQIGSSSALEGVLNDPAWDRCRFVISGRPYAIQRDWKSLFAGRDWNYIRLEEFDEDQQEEFLGRLSSDRSRLQEIPEEARSILGVPRVLLYLAKVDENRLSTLRTAADIFNFAIDKLLEEGLTNSVDALSIATPIGQQVSFARRLLAVIAYQMTLSKDPGTWRPPNFDRIVEGETFDAFCQMLASHYSGVFHRDFHALAMLNNFLEHGLFDTDHTDLREIQFSNRSLQEFFCAMYMATRDVSADRKTWRNWQTVPHDESSNEFYQIWQFLCDMPDEAIDINNQAPWLRAIQPLYRQGDGTVQGTRRSTEMIFRSWSRLNRLCRAGDRLALEIRTTWLGEFQQILEGSARGATPERQVAARELKESFLTLPAGEYQMGSSEGHQRQVREPVLAYYERWLRHTMETGDQEAGLRAETTDRFYDRTTQERRWLKGRRAVLERALVAEQQQSGSGMNIIVDAIFPMDETPAGVREQMIENVAFSRMPTLNAWYRLFEPGHGQQGPSWMTEEYVKVSGGIRQPVIHVSWFDAWTFAQWAHWEGQSCRLPWENEWEYAAKFGLSSEQWDQRYWWGNSFGGREEAFANLNRKMGCTTEPTREHACTGTKQIDPSGQGIMDLLGNVREWCQDRYRQNYVRTELDSLGGGGNTRVLRGGSWSDVPQVTRLAVRRWNSPVYRNDGFGFRLSRTP